MRKIITLGIMLLFLGICIIPNVNSNISKKDTLSYNQLEYIDFLNYPEHVYSKITNPFNPIAPENLNYKTAYKNKDFSITQTDSKVVKKSSSPLSNGNTLYVGGSGPNNYTDIDDAIHDASEGDTVFVYDDSSPYYEKHGITILKSINLIGENKETTIIDGRGPTMYTSPVITIRESAEGVTISGFTIQNSGDFFIDSGIEIRSSYNNITGNIISNNFYGIALYATYSTVDYNAISDNIFTSNFNGGAFFVNSKNNMISKNTFSDNLGGVIFEAGSDYNNVSDNVFHNDGIWFSDAYHNTFSNNLVNDKPIIFMKDESDINIDVDDVGQVLLVSCDNITVQDYELSDTCSGILLANTHNCLISGNTISSNKWGGIYLKDSSNNNISMNTISDSNSGMVFINSDHNFICSNIVSSNEQCGIWLYSLSNDNTILMNTLSDNYGGLGLEGNSNYNNVIDNVFTNDGVWIYGAWENTFLNNMVNDKPLIYLEYKSDMIIDDDAGQVILVNCDSITVQEQELSNTCVGIILMNAHNCIISGNIFDSNKVHGIFLTHSSNNNISMNTVSNSFRGITFDTSDENIIHWNNINSNNRYGIWLSSSNNNIISNNDIRKNGGKRFIDDGLGVFLHMSPNNEVSYNNFINNARTAFFNEANKTKWHKNYWNRPKLLPKLIRGESANIWPFDIRFNFDWRPALEPYDIGV